eukprot:SAG22_NODE_295_length_12850_cov_9.179202_1_plen_182_part_00
MPTDVGAVTDGSGGGMGADVIFADTSFNHILAEYHSDQWTQSMHWLDGPAYNIHKAKAGAYFNPDNNHVGGLQPRWGSRYEEYLRVALRDCAHPPAEPQQPPAEPQQPPAEPQACPCGAGLQNCDCDNCGFWGCYECVTGGWGPDESQNWCRRCRGEILRSTLSRILWTPKSTSDPRARDY